MFDALWVKLCGGSLHSNDTIRLSTLPAPPTSLWSWHHCHSSFTNVLRYTVNYSFPFQNKGDPDFSYFLHVPFLHAHQKFLSSLLHSLSTAKELHIKASSARHLPEQNKLAGPLLTKQYNLSLLRLACVFLYAYHYSSPPPPPHTSTSHKFLSTKYYKALLYSASINASFLSDKQRHLQWNFLLICGSGLLFPLTKFFFLANTHTHIFMYTLMLSPVNK